MSAKASNYYLLFANGLIKLKINNKIYTTHHVLDNIKCQIMSTILNISPICQRPLHSLCLELRCKDRQTFQNEQEKMKKNWFQEDKKKGTNSYSLFLFFI